jgi:hypothetical protein
MDRRRGMHVINISSKDYLAALDLNGSDIMMRRAKSGLSSPIIADLQ